MWPRSVEGSAFRFTRSARCRHRIGRWKTAGSLDALIEADLTATILTGGPFGRGAQARLRATIELSGAAAVGAPSRVTTGDAEDYAAVAFSPGGTPFGNVIVAETLGTGTIMVDPLQAIGVEFELNGTAVGQVFSDSSLTSDILSLNSLGFVPGELIFDLPAGFTLNAPELGIENNRWVGVGPPPQVPLSATGPFLLASLAVLVGTGRRFIGRDVSENP